MPPRMLPEKLKKTGKMIYVVRNPKDAQVSMHYMGGPPDDGWDGSFERLMNPRSPQVRLPFQSTFEAEFIGPIAHFDC